MTALSIGSTAPSASKAAAWAIVPTAALLTLNGLYLGAAYRVSPALFWLLDIVQFALVPALSLWLLYRIAGVRPRDYGLGTIVAPKQGAASALALYALVVAVFAGGYGFARVLTLFIPWEWPATAFLYSQAIPQHPGGALAMVAYLALSAAFVEEIFYRGLPALCVRQDLYPVVSAAAFAAIHWESGTRDVAATFLLGLVLALLYLRIRNLWPFVAGHAVTDMLAFTGTYAY
jgi:membrane protease YdiL (CAAX protease family)